MTTDAVYKLPICKAGKRQTHSSDGLQIYTTTEPSEAPHVAKVRATRTFLKGSSVATEKNLLGYNARFDNNGAVFWRWTIIVGNSKTFLFRFEVDLLTQKDWNVIISIVAYSGHQHVLRVVGRGRIVLLLDNET